MRSTVPSATNIMVLLSLAAPRATPSALPCFAHLHASPVLRGAFLTSLPAACFAKMKARCTGESNSCRRRDLDNVETAGISLNSVISSRKGRGNADGDRACCAGARRATSGATASSARFFVPDGQVEAEIKCVLYQEIARRQVTAVHWLPVACTRKACLWACTGGDHTCFFLSSPLLCGYAPIVFATS